MSLRMSSLDPNEPRAAKDCRVCNRRRIRCDRSLPTCKKCALKEVACPGYGIRIQFGQGVASRGKLMGKALPVIEAAPSSSSADATLALGSTSSLPHDQRSDVLNDYQGRCSLDTPPGEPYAALPQAYDSLHSQEYRNITFANPFALNTQLSTDHLPPYLQGRPVEELIRYYDNHVANIMSWVDGPENPWRTLIIPLAIKSQSLLLAILALAAEHYASRFPSIVVTDGLRSSYYRDKSLHLLAQDLQTEISADVSPARRTQASGILATILVLCNLEMIRCETGAWHVHWKAVRTITKHWTAPHLASTILDDTCRYLLKEAFVYDVFGSSTTFGDLDQIPSSVLTGQDAGLFTQWLQLIQEITVTERRRSEGLSSWATLPPDLSNMQVIEQRFQYARQGCRDISQSFDFDTPTADPNFLILIDIFHHAGLAYSFSTLLDTSSQPVQTALDTNIRAVIDAISQIEHDSAHHHNLVWPLFVVGSQCRHNQEIQRFAESKLIMVMRSTNFSNCRPALEFLQRFWKSDPNVTTDWTQFAREESRLGHHFLVI